MKNLVLGLAAGLLLTFSLTSCGEKLLTDEQVQAEIAAGVNAAKGAIETEMDAKCNADYQARVDAEYIKLKAEYDVQKAATPAK